MNAWQATAALLRAVLIMSAAGSVVALVLFLLKPLMKNRIPKAAQYYLWTLVLVALIVPFSAFVSIPVGTPIAPVQEIVEDNIKTNAERYEEISQRQYNAPFDELEVEHQVEIIYESKGWLNNYLLTMPLTIGVTIFLITAVQYVAFVVKLRHDRVPANDDEMAVLRQLGKGSRTLRLHRSRLAPTPMLIGIFRPAILLPDREYSDARLRNILLHELVHLRRRDILLKWLFVAARSLHWFNPIVYLACREADRACELSCDEAAIKGLDANGKQSYGDTLIAMAAAAKTPRTILSTTMCEEKKTLRERLGAIMKHGRFSAGAIAVSCALAAAFLCGTVVLGASALEESAADVLFRTLKNEASGVRPESIVEQMNIDDEGTLIFYYNANGNLACAVLEKGAFNDRLSKTSAELSVAGSVPAQIMAGQYNDGKNWLAWGILRDQSITKALMYGREATIVAAGGLRLCFALGEGRMSENDDFQFLDAAGNPVWEISSSKELTVYVWKDRSLINYALFSGHREQQSREEVYSGENILQSLDALNMALSDYPFDYLELHIVQMNLLDFSKEEMSALAEQIEIPLRNYSCSVGYFDN